MIENIIFCGFGGFIGAILRYKLGGFIFHRTNKATFPISTFVINFLGSFLFGLLFFLNYNKQILNPHLVIFLFTGILGAFTTFSAFCYDTVYLIERKKYLLVFLNLFLSVIFCLVAVFCGKKLALFFCAPA